MGTLHVVRNEPDEVPDTAAIIDVSERLLAESRALLDDMSQQLGTDVFDQTDGSATAKLPSPAPPKA